ADLDTFVRNLAAALLNTQNDKAVRDRFVQRVLAHGHYRDEQAVLDALKYANLELRTYNIVNTSETTYGYARLDAFGRIYNRVLEHVLTSDLIRTELKDVVPAAKLDAILGKENNTLSGIQRDEIFATLTDEQLIALKNKITNQPNAPVSYPFLWDIPQHDYVQW